MHILIMNEMNVNFYDVSIFPLLNNNNVLSNQVKYVCKEIKLMSGHFFVSESVDFRTPA